MMTLYQTEIKLTATESEILKYLHNQCDKISKEAVPVSLVKSLVDMCSSWAMAANISHVEPKLASKSLKSLLKIGLIVEYEDSQGYPAFVPVTRNVIIEYSYRDIEQKDIW